MKKLILSTGILFIVFINSMSQTPQPYIYKESGEVHVTVTLLWSYGDSSQIEITNRQALLDTSLTTRFLLNIRGVTQTIVENKIRRNTEQQEFQPVVTYAGFKVAKVTIADISTQQYEPNTGQERTVTIRIE